MYVDQDATKPRRCRTITVGTTDGNSDGGAGLAGRRDRRYNGFDKLQDGIKVSVRAPQMQMARQPARTGRRASRVRQAAKTASPRRKDGRLRAVSPSRPFILRPVATSLLMAAILLAGFVAYPAAAGFRAAGSGLSDDPGRHVLSGRKSRT